MRFWYFRKTGFTFLETVFVISILAVLLSLAIVRVNPASLLKVELKDSAQRLAGDLRYTRSLAINNVAQYSLLVDISQNQYGIYDSGSTLIGEMRTVNRRITLSGDDKFIFEPLGNASSGQEIIFRVDLDVYHIAVTQATGMIRLRKE